MQKVRRFGGVSPGAERGTLSLSMGTAGVLHLGALVGSLTSAVQVRRGTSLIAVMGTSTLSGTGVVGGVTGGDIFGTGDTISGRGTGTILQTLSAGGKAGSVLLNSGMSKRAAWRRRVNMAVQFQWESMGGKRTLLITVNNVGTVIKARIFRSSGDPAVDRRAKAQALKMDVPAPPEGMDGPYTVKVVVR